LKLSQAGGHGWMHPDTDVNLVLFAFWTRH
jgi:hypothetical protein